MTYDYHESVTAVTKPVAVIDRFGVVNPVRDWKDARETATAAREADK